MAGMLAAGLKTLPDHTWEAIFGGFTAWFAWRAARDGRANGARSLASRHFTLDLFHSAAMLYMFAGLTTANRMDMTGMSGGAAQSLRYPTLALAFALVLVCCCVWDVDQLSERRNGVRVAASASAGPVHDIVPWAGRASPIAGARSDTATISDDASDGRLCPLAVLLSPAVTAACRIAMGITMAFALLIMI